MSRRGGIERGRPYNRDVTLPYRKPGEPAPIPRELRRWFTKSNASEKGPFEASAILLSLKEGYLKTTTLVRAEDETEWRPLGGVYELAVERASCPRSPSAPRGPAPRLAPSGSYAGGFLLGIFLGLLGMIIAYVRREPEARRGARNGFLARLVFVLFVVLLTSIFSR